MAFFIVNRYAINNDSTDWSAAEGQIANIGRGGSATVVSVKSITGGTKRKLEEGSEGKDKDKKPTRRGKKLKR
jgi:N-acetyltransferase 10